MKKLFAILVVAGVMAACNDEGGDATNAGDSTLVPAPDTLTSPIDTIVKPADSTVKK